MSSSELLISERLEIIAKIMSEKTAMSYEEVLSNLTIVDNGYIFPSMSLL